MRGELCIADLLLDHLRVRPLLELPIDRHLPSIRAALTTHRAVVVTAAPGAGKTTRVPPALLADGPVFVLQPRRVAARAIARRIADEQGWTVGREVGWHVRFDRRVSADTVLTIATEGILTARLQQDPFLTGIRTIVLDEFHERSIHADLGLALARQAWSARPDLRMVVMSATIDTGRVAEYLGSCPVIAVPGRAFPLAVEYRPGVTVEDAVREVRDDARGAILCFLPGAREIQRAAANLGTLGVPVLPLHGGLPAQEQDAALAASAGVRVILATNLAETTVTVPDVTTVIDTGWHKVARYDAERAIDALRLERVPLDSAEQRAGRAGRVQAGRVLRLWDSRDRLRAHREPEIFRVDLATAMLDVVAWGGDPRGFEWLESPPPAAIEAALHLLRRLEAIDDHGRLTPGGAQLQRWPLHPRLGRLYRAAGCTVRAARVCAALAEAGDSALLDAAWEGRPLPPHVEQVARHLSAASDRPGKPSSPADDDQVLRRAVLSAYPDRVAKRRSIGNGGNVGNDRCVLASGTGARLARHVTVGDEYFAALEVTAPTQAGQSEALVRSAVGIERAWLMPTRSELRHQFDADAGVVRAARVDWYDNLMLSEHPVAPESGPAEDLLVEAWTARGPSERDAQMLRRLAFARVDVEVTALVREAARGRIRLDDVHLGHADAGQVARLAPATLLVPSGRDIPLRYEADGSVVAAVKLQELFGLAETPVLGPSRVPVTFELLAPNGRPVQVTRDLRSFWTRGYQEVRRELRARYPKHPWPDDPWTATPTHRTTRRK
jgi:ATP-dependent helicase HrpB